MRPSLSSTSPFRPSDLYSPSSPAAGADADADADQALEP